MNQVSTSRIHKGEAGSKVYKLTVKILNSGRDTSTCWAERKVFGPDISEVPTSHTAPPHFPQGSGRGLAAAWVVYRSLPVRVCGKQLSVLRGAAAV